MYNAEQKTKFITQYTEKESIEKACVALFEAVARYEEGWAADLCTKSTAELEPVVRQLVGMRLRSGDRRLNILKSYVRWCMEQGVPGACDGMLSVTIGDVEKLSRQTVKNPRHLQVYLDSVFLPEDEKTVDNVFRCFYWLAYAGMKEEDILNVTAGDVRLQDMTVLYKGTEYPIYREALPCIKNCMKLSYFVKIYPNYRVEKERAAGDILLRGTSLPAVKSFRTALSRRSAAATRPDGSGGAKTELELSYFRVWLSGLFYRVYEAELAGAHNTVVTFLAVVTEQKKDFHYSLGRNTQASKHRKVAMEYQRDYERWKQTLN